jgi:hypothetical protein
MRVLAGQRSIARLLSSILIVSFHPRRAAVLSSREGWVEGEQTRVAAEVEEAEGEAVPNT